MSLKKEIGIVIKIINFEDFNQIVTILTKDEILSFIALGVRKIKSKNRVALQLGNIVEVEMFKARLKNKLSKVKKASIVKQLPIKNGDTALIFYEILKYLKNFQSTTPKILQSFLQVSNYWGGESNQKIKTFILFSFFEVIGKKPIMNCCAECGRRDNILGFEFFIGGFTCNLHTRTPLSLKTLLSIKSLGLSWQKYKHVDFDVNLKILKMIQEELNHFLY